jgi:hypothetical protein
MPLTTISAPGIATRVQVRPFEIISIARNTICISQQLYAHQADPTVPLPDSFPKPPALDPGRGWQFDLNLGGEYKTDRTVACLARLYEESAHS